MSNLADILRILPTQCKKFNKINQLFGLIICVISINLTVFALPTELDLSFGNAGKVVSSPDGSESSFGSDMALQSDGKIVMVGGSSANPGFFVTRFNSNGSLDTAFGNNG